MSAAHQQEDTSCPKLVYTTNGATLRVSEEPLPVTDPGLKVQVRGREQLVYSDRFELPEYIFPPSEATFPLGVTVDAPHTDGSTHMDSELIAEHATAARALLDDKLTKHGAVVFRGLPLSTADDFATFVEALGPGWEAVKLGGGGTQRTDVAKGVRTASDEPPEQTIEPHSDMGHSQVHPKRIAFFALVGPPAGAGGETVLTNLRKVYAELEKVGIVRQFQERGGVAYRKTLWSAARAPANQTYTWQKFFFTDSPTEAKAEVQKRDVAAEMNDDDVIIFKEILSAVHTHPVTNESTWFNGVHTNHESYYLEAKHIDTSMGSPMNTEFADGTEIQGKMIADIRAAWWKNSVAIPVVAGTLIVVDNMLAGHGRMSWVRPHPRKMLLTHFK